MGSCEQVSHEYRGIGLLFYPWVINLTFSHEHDVTKHGLTPACR